MAWSVIWVCFNILLEVAGSGRVMLTPVEG